MQSALTLTAFVAAAAVLGPPPCAAQEAVADFYKGKQISVLVGFSPGGSSSLYAQALARHMGRHLPGSPSFIVQHAPGAGGLVAANNVSNTAPRDGTVFAITGRTVAIEPLLGNKNAKFDGRQFNWIGTANVEYTTCTLWHTAKVKTLQDALSTEAVVGGSGADATEVIFPKAANKLVGTKFKIVLGYPGSTEILLAMERGEVEGFCGIGWTFLKLRKGDWLRAGKVNILYQMSLEKHPELPHVPAIIDHVKTADDARCSSSCLRPRKWAGRSSRRPACRPSGCRRCARPSRRPSKIRSSWPRPRSSASRCSTSAASGSSNWSSASTPPRPR
jgi:tripartite-type tricarboxylate transporter receptor subunit TctC